MTTSLPIDLEALEPLENPSAFSNIIFCISGNVHPKVEIPIIEGYLNLFFKAWLIIRQLFYRFLRAY